MEERYWVKCWDSTASTPTTRKKNPFIDLITGRVWFFKEYCTARQRAEFTHDALDFHGALGNKSRTTWFFWRPHLAELMDLAAMHKETTEKHKAACAIRGFARRMTTLRVLRGTTDRKKGTRMIEWSKHVQGDRRVAIDKLQRSRALGRATKYVRNTDHHSFRRLADYEDRVIPSMRRSIQEKRDSEVLQLVRVELSEARSES